MKTQSEGTMDENEREEKRTCYLTVYQTGRQYGGPEEGGWWYTVYSLEAAIPFSGTALIRRREMEDDEMWGGGYDPTLLHRDDDGNPILTVGTVKEFDDPAAVEAERNRLTKLYSDHRGRLRDYVIVEEVYRGELERLTGRRYC